ELCLRHDGGAIQIDQLSRAGDLREQALGTSEDVLAGRLLGGTGLAHASRRLLNAVRLLAPEIERNSNSGPDLPFGHERRLVEVVGAQDEVRIVLAPREAEIRLGALDARLRGAQQGGSLLGEAFEIVKRVGEGHL